MTLGLTEKIAVGVIAGSVLVTGAALGFGSGAEPSPGPGPTTTSTPPLPPEPTGSTTTVAPAALTEDAPISTSGVGSLVVGGTLEEAGVAPVEEPGDGCATTTLDGVRGIEVTLLDGRVATVAIDEGGWKTLSGVGLGASAADVRRTYADQVQEEDGALVFVPRDPDDVNRVAFELSGDVVSRIVAGSLGEVEERCG